MNDDMTLEQKIATVGKEARKLNGAGEQPPMVCVWENAVGDKWCAMIIDPSDASTHVLVRGNGNYKTVTAAVNSLARALELKLHVEDGARETTKYINKRIEQEGSRFTWQPGDMEQVSPAPGPQRKPADKPKAVPVPRVSKYILMRHDPKGNNHEYLYEYAEIVQSLTNDLGDEAAAVDILQVSGNDEERASYNARYQLGRLGSGLETVGDHNVYDTLEAARVRALEISASLVEIHRKRG